MLCLTVFEEKYFSSYILLTIFHHFKRASIEEDKTNFFKVKGKSPALNQNSHCLFSSTFMVKNFLFKLVLSMVLKHSMQHDRST